MALQITDPTEDPNWDSLLLESGNHSFFHSASWARVLVESYKYKPLYFASIDRGRLMFLMPFMEIHSSLTGRRGVSLPFTDHCAPFTLKNDFLDNSVREVMNYGENAKWKYVEWRDASYFSEGVLPSETYYAHDLNLGLTEAELFASLRDNNRRNINKALKDGLSVEVEQSLGSVNSFYRLNCMTRKRHGLPPQPYAFFKNIFAHVISKGNGIVVSAHHSEKPIAASVFFHFGTSALYKYGASDMTYQNLRPNNLIMWEAIKWYRNRAFKTLSLGRTEIDNPGLLQYKRTWGAKETMIKYVRYDYKKRSYVHGRADMTDSYKKIFARMPVRILRIIGLLLNKHFG